MKQITSISRLSDEDLSQLREKYRIRDRDKEFREALGALQEQAAYRDSLYSQLQMQLSDLENLFCQEQQRVNKLIANMKELIAAQQEEIRQLKTHFLMHHPTVSSSKEFETEVDADGCITILKYCGSDENVVIPERINGKLVVTIREFAFAGCTSLTSVTIPDGVSFIGNLAFSNCSNLTTAVLPEGLVHIGELAFSRCTKLRHFQLPSSVTVIGRRAFSQCPGLTTIAIPDRVTLIEQNTFAKCTGLTDIIIPNSVTSIKKDAFWGCVHLTIHCAPGSYAETYAHQNKIPVRSVIPM